MIELAVYRPRIVGAKSSSVEDLLPLLLQLSYKKQNSAEKG